MVAALKKSRPRALKKEERSVLLPGPEATWERWILGPSGEPVLAEVCPDLRAASSLSTLALPVRHVVAVPLWLNQTDPVQIAALVPLQMEARDVTWRQAGPLALGWQIITSAPPRSLVLVGVLGQDVPIEIARSNFQDYDLSVRYRTFAEDSVTLWIEQEQLCVAVTRGRSLVYFQALPDATLTARVFQDLRCLRAALTIEEVIGPLRSLVLWFKPSDSALQLLQEELDLPVKVAALPMPRNPGKSWGLVPPTVVTSQKNARQQKWVWRSGLVFLAVYLVVIAGLLSHLYFKERRIADVQGWRMAHQEALDHIRRTQVAWKDLDPVVRTSHYPLEVLLHATDDIPAQALHLTLFDFSEHKLQINGEAKDAASVFQFREALTKNPHLNGYHWDDVQPHLLPNDLAQFQLHADEAP